MKKVRFGFFIFIILSVLITYLSVYLPLRNELENATLENFKLLSQTKYQSFNYIVEKSVQGAKSVSSRSAIRDKISEYQNHLISFDELKKFTQTKYKDGVMMLDGLVFAERIVANTVVAEYGEKNDVFAIKDIVADSNVHYDFRQSDNFFFMQVYSPIAVSGELLGYDLIVYDLTKEIEALTESNIGLSIYDKKQTEAFLSEQTTSPVQGSGDYFETLIDISSLVPINDEYYLHINIPRRDFFSKINSISLYSMGGFILSLLMLYVIIIILIMKNTEKLLDSIGRSRDNYKNITNYDTLTGAYTRLFLDRWLSEERNGIQKEDKYYTVIMIDVNSFKEINDDYGHDTGDQVLKSIVKTVKSKIREHDFIVRYGGDEFIVVLADADENVSEAILKRVTDELLNMETYAFKIALSYGVKSFKKSEDFSHAIIEADQRMYMMKKNKKLVGNQ
ncbi:MAG: GGDEF domain-containing protein [Clostridiales bacterium]|nr:GGDEF domain-containing protein [Clostridiales bacterium]